MDEILVEKTVIHSKEFGNRFIREWELSKSDLVPSEFICPMTLDIMVDPVVIASGQTYERSYIERWFREGHKTCPKTNQVLPHTNICPNYAVRAVIENWCKKNGIVLSKKICPKEKTRATILGNLNLNENENKNSNGDLKKKNFSFFKTQEAFPLPHGAAVHRSNGGVNSAKSNLSIEVGNRIKSQVHPKPSTPTHRRQFSLPASPVAIVDGNAGAIPDKFSITKSCKAQRLNQFKQMMVQFSAATSENSGENSLTSPTIPNANSANAHETHRNVPKNSINVPHNLSLTKIPIQPPQVHSLVGLPNQRKGHFTGRKLSTIYSPSSDPLSKPPIDFSDSSVSAVLPDWSADIDIKSVLNKLSNGSIGEIRAASEEMRGLSKASQATRMRIFELGGIPKLITLLKSSDLLIVEHVVTALLNLALESTLKIEIVKCGALRPLADILSNKKCSDKASENATGALCSLSVAEENRDMICSEGIIPLLVDTFKNRKSLRGMKDASIGLFNLAISPSGRKLVVSTGIVSHLIKMLAEGDLQVEEEVMALLSNLSKAEEACMLLENEGAIAFLVGVLEDGSSRSKISAVSVLLQMAASDSSRESMWEEGVIPCLVGLSQGVINGRGREKVIALLKILRETH